MNEDLYPIVYLNELMDEQGVTVSYRFVYMGDNISPAICEVTTSGHTFVGRGIEWTIADAKVKAAVSFLEQLGYACEQTISEKAKMFREIVETQLKLNPIGTLQNLCMQRGWRYPLYQYQGFGPNKLHIIKCTVENYTAKVTCRVKHEAKRRVAEMVFRMIVDLCEPTERPVENERSSSLPSESHLNENPIGGLQELCVAEHLNLPIYEVHPQDLVDKTFTVTCTVGTHTENGVGRSKKAAKTKAAILVYEQLKNHWLPAMRSEPSVEQTPVEFEATAVCCTQEVQSDVRTLVELIRSSDKPTITLLRTSRSFGSEPLSMLRDIENEEGFDVVFTILDEDTDVGIVAQVSVGNLMTYVGTGDTHLMAVENAAVCALIHMIQHLN